MMSRYWDIDPGDIDPDTGRPYSNYSSPSLDTSFHDAEMAGGDDEFEGVDNRELLRLYRAGDDAAGEELLRRQSDLS